MFRRLAVACLAALCLANCSTVVDAACVAPGPCACPDGSRSVQPCQGDGSFGACDCAPSRTCATDADCRVNAACAPSGTEARSCVCKAGFGGDGAFCDPYPLGPYGTRVGTVIKNIVLNGYLEPASPEPAWGPVRLDQFYDSRGALGPDGGPLKVLLVMVGSAACPRCNAVAPTERALCQNARANGLACMTALQKSVNGTTPAQSDADYWVSKHEIDFAVVLDPNGAWNPYVVKDGAIEWPAFVFVNARDMTIAAIRSYDDDLRPTLDELLGTSP